MPRLWHLRQLLPLLFVQSHSSWKNITLQFFISLSLSLPPSSSSDNFVSLETMWKRGNGMGVVKTSGWVHIRPGAAAFRWGRPRLWVPSVRYSAFCSAANHRSSLSFTYHPDFCPPPPQVCVFRFLCFAKSPKSSSNTHTHTHTVDPTYSVCVSVSC